jgi:hypothetical protein
MNKTQADGLRRIRDRGQDAWIEGQHRAGGSVARMFERMTDLGYCTVWPCVITEAGRKALDIYDDEHRR